jgi:hypothetical protein
MFLVSVKPGNNLLLKFGPDDGTDGSKSRKHAGQFFGKSKSRSSDNEVAMKPNIWEAGRNFTRTVGGGRQSLKGLQRKTAPKFVALPLRLSTRGEHLNAVLVCSWIRSHCTVLAFTVYLGKRVCSFQPLIGDLVKTVIHKLHSPFPL